MLVYTIPYIAIKASMQGGKVIPLKVIWQALDFVTYKIHEWQSISTLLLCSAPAPMILAGKSAVVLLAATLVQAITYGTIVAPTAGTNVVPGMPFPFSYHSLNSSTGSGCAVSLAYTVWLATTLPNSTTPSTDFSAGTYLGRYSDTSTTLAPPPPGSLTTPDYSKSPYNNQGTGVSKTNAPVWLAVLEEYFPCTGEFTEATS